MPGELEHYMPDNVSVSNGVLNLTAKRETSNDMLYTSGLIDTGGDVGIGGKNLPGFSFKYGYIEARMKLTKGAGLWPAFWMLPAPLADGSYHDGDGEIDVMEQIGSSPTVTEGHLHHITTVGKAVNTGIDLSAGFHTYGLDWESDHMTWYFDGSPFFTTSANVPNVAMYPIFNLAIGDATSWPGAPDGNTIFPQSLQIDYVRVYQPTPLPVDPLPGDANLDGRVDATDLGILATNYGTTTGATRAMGDLNGDGRVDITDLGILATNWQTVASSAPIAAPTGLFSQHRV
jgi:beta-glucanase (GH16 family)